MISKAKQNDKEVLGNLLRIKKYFLQKGAPEEVECYDQQIKQWKEWIAAFDYSEIDAMLERQSWRDKAWRKLAVDNPISTTNTMLDLTS